MEQTNAGIQRVVELAGSQGRLAETLGVTQQAVSEWVRRGYAPANRVVEIEAQYGVPRTALIDPRLRDLLVD
jgi:DNA-binding transcriptional regulator YdaS (Cro superfamily)